AGDEDMVRVPVRGVVFAAQAHAVIHGVGGATRAREGRIQVDRVGHAHGQRAFVAPGGLVRSIGQLGMYVVFAVGGGHGPAGDAAPGEEGRGGQRAVVAAKAARIVAPDRVVREQVAPAPAVAGVIGKGVIHERFGGSELA